MNKPPLATGIVGAGRVAQALGRLLIERGEPVVALAARSPDRAARAIRFMGPSVEPVALGDLPGKASRIIIAVTDSAIPPIADALVAAGMTEGCVLHTSGASDASVLASLGRAGVACGVLHPLQTVPSPERGRDSLVGATFGISGDEPAVSWAMSLVDRVAGTSLRVPREGFAAYHAAAALTGNGTAALVDAALELMAQAGIDRQAALRALAPLGRTSMANVFSVGPENALTGPVARGDLQTIQVHLAALADAAPSVSSLYRAAGLQLVDLATRGGLSADRASEMRALLSEALGRQP